MSHSLFDSEQALLARVAMDKAPDAILWLTPAGTVAYANEAMCRLTGFSPAELLEKTIFQLSASADPTTWPTHWAELKEEGVKHFSAEHFTHTGELIPVHISANYLVFKDQEYNCSFIRDERAILRNKQALLETEDRFTKLVNSVPGIVYQFVLRPDGTAAFPYISPKVEPMFHLTVQQLQESASHIVQLIHPEDAERFQNSVLKSAETLQPWQEELHFVLTDGTDIYTQAHSLPEKQPNGEILWTGFFFDITPQKILEDQLLLSRQAIEASLDGITIADARQPDMPLVYVNPAFETVTGYTREDVFGKNCRFLQGTDTDQPGLTTLRQALKEGTQCVVLLRNYHKDGSLFWNELQISPVHNTKGELTHFIGVQKDVTGRVENEQKLQEAYQTTRSALRETQVLFAVGQALVSSNNLSGNLAQCVEIMNAQNIYGQIQTITLLKLESNEQLEPEWAEVMAVWSVTDSAFPVGFRFYLPHLPFSQLWLSSPNQPLFIEDSQTDDRIDPATQQIFKQSHTLSSLIMPLRIGQRWVGLFIASWSEIHHFTALEQRVSSALMGQFSSALDSAVLFSQTEAALKETQALYTAGEALTSSTSLENNLVAMLERLNQAGYLAHAENISLSSIEVDAAGEPEWAEVLAIWARTQPIPFPVGTRFYLPHIPLTNLWKNSPNQPVFIEDTQTDPRVDEVVRQVYDAAGAKSALLIPLQIANRWVGQANLIFLEPTMFTPAERRICTNLTNLLASAVNNVILLNQTEATLEKTRILLEIEEILNSASNLTDGMHLAVQTLQKHHLFLGADNYVLSRVMVDEHNDPTDMNILVAWSQHQDMSSLVGAIYPIAPFSQNEMWLNNPQEPAFIEDVVNDERLNEASKKINLDNHIQACVQWPLRLGSRWVGHLNLMWFQPYTFSKLEREVADELLTPLANIIENYRLLEQAQQRAQQMETVAKVASVATATLDSHELLQRTADLVQESFGLYHTHIFLLNKQTQILELAAASGEIGRQALKIKPHYDLSDERSVVARAGQAKTTQIINDINASGITVRRNPLLPDVKSVMAIPLLSGSNLLGVLNIQSNEVNTFDPEVTQTLTTLAAQIVVALQNAQTFEQIAEQAEIIRSAETLLATSTLDGTITFINEAGLHLFGYDKMEGMIGLSSLDFYDKASRRLILKEALPIVMEKGSWRGEVTIQRQDGKLFAADQTLFLIRNQDGSPRMLATNILDVSTQKRVEVELAKQADELAIVSEVSTIVSTIRDPQTLLQTVVDLTKERFNLYHAHVLLLDDTRETLVLTAGAGEIGQKMVQEGRRIPYEAGNSLVASVARAKVGQIRNYDEAAEGFMPHPLLVDTRSEMALPMLVGGEILGVLDVRSEKSHYFTEQDIRIYTTLASQVAGALQNARFFATTAQTQQELNALTRRLTREGWSDYLAEQEEKILSFGYDLQQVETLTEQSNGHQPTIKMPLRVQGEAIGELALDEPETFADEEVQEIIRAVADQLSAHLENLRLTEQTQTALSETETLYQAITQLNAAESYEAVIEALRQHALFSQGVSNISLNYFDRPYTDYQPAEWSNVLARWSRLPLDAVQPRYPLKPFSAMFKLFNGNTPLVIDNFETFPGLDDNFRTLYIKQFQALSTIFIPLVAGGQWLGYVNAIYPEPQKFREADVRQLMTIAQQAAVTVQGIYLNQQREQALAKTDALYTGSNQITRAQTVDEVLKALVSYTPLHKLDRVSLIFFNRAWQDEMPELGTSIAVWLQEGDPAQSAAPPGTTYELPRFPFVKYFDRYRPILFSDAFVDERVDENTRLAMQRVGSKGILVVPLLASNQWVGVMLAQTQAAMELSEDEVRQIVSLTDQAATVLQNRRLFEQTQQALAETADQARRLAQLNEMGTALSTAQSQDEVFKIAATYTKQIINCSRVSLTLYDAKDGKLVLYALDGEKGAIPLNTRLPLEKTIVGRVFSEQKIYNFGEVTEHFDHQALAKQGLTSVLSAPLITQKIIGTLNLGHVKPQAFGKNDENLVQQIASLVSTNYENRNLLQQTREALSETETLYDLSAKLNAAGSYQEILNALQTSPIVANSVGSTLSLIERDEQDRPVATQIVAMWSKDNPGEVTNSLRGQSFSLQDSATTKTWLFYPYYIFLIPNAQESELLGEQTRELFVATDIHSTVFMPISTRDRWIGLISINWREAQVFDERMERTLNAVSPQVAVAVNNQLLLEQAQSRAGQLEKLAYIESQLSQATTEEQVVTTLGNALGFPYDISLQYVLEDKDNQPAFQVPMMMWRGGVLITDDPRLNKPIPLDRIPTSRLWIESPNEVLYVENADSDSRLGVGGREMYKQLGIKSIALLPLRSGGAWQGTIVFSAPVAYTFSEEEKFIFARLLESAGAILASRRSLLAQKEALSEAEALYAASVQFNRAEKVEDVLKVIISSVESSGAYSAILWTMETDNTGHPSFQTLEASWTQDGSPPRVPLGSRFSSAQSPGSKVWINSPGEVIAIPDIEKSEVILSDQFLVTTLRVLGIKGVVYLPLTLGSRWVGLVTLQWNQVFEFSGRDERLFKTLAAQAATTIDGLLLLKNIRERAQQLEILSKIETGLSKAVNENEILTALVSHLPGLFMARLDYVLTDAHNTPERLQTSAMYKDGQLRPPDEFPPLLQVNDYAISKLWVENPQTFLFIGDVTKDERLVSLNPDQPVMRTTDMKSLAVIPLQAAGRWQAVLSYWWVEPHNLTPVETFIFRQIIEPLGAVVASRRSQLEQAAAEAALREISSLQKGILDNAPYAIIATATDGTILTFNVGGEKMLGYAAEELVNKMNPGVFHLPEEVVKRAAVLEKELNRPVEVGFETFIIKVRELGGVDENEWTYVRKDGYHFPVELTVTSLKTDSGDIIGYLGVATDITERKRAQEALLRAQRETEVLYQASRRINESSTNLQEIMATLGQLNAHINFNRAVLMVFQYENKEMVSATVTANWYSGVGMPPTTIGTRYTRQIFQSIGLFVLPETRFINNAQNTADMDKPTQVLMERLAIKAMAILPLWIGNRQIGTILLESEQEHHFVENDTRLYLSLLPQIAVAIENQMLFDQAQSRARREQVLREITEKVRSSTDVEMIMKTAAAEIGQALGRKAFIQLASQSGPTEE